MNAIVCNTQNGAVTEYTRHAFQSITPTHAGSATGLFKLEGDTDDGLPIVGEIRIPPTLRESTLKKCLNTVYVAMIGEGNAELTVFGRPDSWAYSFPLRDSGETRCIVGRGIRENYLGFGLRTPEGQQFTLDRIEVMTLESKTRRV